MEYLPVNTRITVVVLTYNRREEVLHTVAQLLALPERPAVIVADNGSTDGTADALGARFPRVRVVRCGTNLGAAARNRAAALATTDVGHDWMHDLGHQVGDLVDRITG